MNLFKKRPVLILVQEDSKGLNTFFNASLLRASEPYKEQLKSFLEGCLKELNNG